MNILIFLHNEYLDILTNKKVVRHKMKRIRSKLNKIGSYDINKISLSCFDDKRYVLDDGVNTLAYFHKEIKPIQKIQTLIKNIDII